MAGLVTEASERMAGGERDSALIGEVTFFDGGRALVPVGVAAESTRGHGYTAAQLIDGRPEYRYMTG